MLLGSQAVKFIAVGAINFWLTMAVFLLSLHCLDLHYLSALLLSWFLGMLFSYIWNFIWVFRPSGQLQFGRRFVKYLLAGSASISLNLAALHVLVEFLALDPFWTQLALIPFIVIFNFLTAKFWSLRRSNLVS
ncbi:GtrA family protein [Rhizobium sp. R86522]|uniref:GtrA family protein n=1 Tax=Rhizobium sp. R86522 TaxID=3093861 RepID=UPI00366D2B6A